MIGVMNDSQIQQFSDLATRLSLEAAEMSLSKLGKASVSRKSDHSYVTEVDHAIQSHIVSAITTAYPDHFIIAEETLEEVATSDRTAKPSSDSRFCWVIDPLDGTRNYVNGFPCFSTSIAVLDQGQPIVGVVTEHNLKRVYSAIAGGGAFVDGEAIRVADAAEDEDLLIGVPSTKDELTKKVWGAWFPMKHMITRNLGSLAIHLALVAEGSLSATFCKRCKIWDIAAGVLLIREAGGVFTDPFGKDYLPFDTSADVNMDMPLLTAGPNVYKRLLETIQIATQ